MNRPWNVLSGSWWATRKTRRPDKHRSWRLRVETLEDRSVPSAVEPPAGLVGWWPGDDSAEDIRGTNDLTMQGGATFAAGKVGQAFRFDGIDDHAFVENAGALNFGTDDFSIELWAQFDAVPVESEVLVNKLGPVVAGTSTGYLLRRLPSGRIQLSYAQDSVHFHNIDTTGTILDAAFHHIAVVRQGGSVMIWIDGTEQPTVTAEGAAGNFDVSNPGPFVLGRLASRPVYCLRGRIDEPSVYNRALSAAEIQGIFGAGSEGKLKNTNPTISAIPDQTTNQDTPTGALAFTVADAETPAGSLIVTATSTNPTLVPNSAIVLGGSGGNRTMTITPAATRGATGSARRSTSTPGRTPAASARR